MQPYLLPNIELINLMSEIIPDDTIFNYSTNLDGFKREPNNLVGIFGMNYNTSKINLPICPKRIILLFQSLNILQIKWDSLKDIL